VRSVAAPAAVVGAASVALVATGGSFSAYNADLGVTLLIYLAIAQAWNILGGFGGQIFLGASAFVGTGGYMAGLLLLHTGVPWAATVVLAALGGVAVALVLSVPLLRLRGDYFAIGSLAGALALLALVQNWTWAGGASGITMPIDRIPTGTTLFRAAVVVAGLATLAAAVVARSSFGLRLTAVRDNEPAAAGLGVSVYRHRLGALVLAGALMAAAGSLVAFQTIAVSPDGAFSFGWSLDALLMTVIGGAGTVLGPFLGVAIVYWALTKELADAQTLALFVEGALLVVVVRFAPRGVWPLVLGFVARFRARRTEEPPMDASAPTSPIALESELV
jgi:branched-chain amino acid transport system permease protein